MRTVPALLALVALTACGGEGERVSKPAPRNDPGLQVWVAQGCGSCHQFAPAGSTATIGPNLSNSLGARDRAYIRESIVAPDKVNGPSIMPQDYGKRISKAELDDLVAFIARGARVNP